MATWLDDTITALKNLGGEAHLNDIFKEVKRIRKTLSPSWTRTIQKELERHSSDSLVWKNVDDSKCRVRKILKYLSNSNDNEISFFEDRIKDYINLLKNKEYIEKIILVTFPHKEHLYNGYDILNNKKNHYSINVSNIVEKIVKNEKKIYHLNFSKLIFERKIYLDNNAFLLYDLASHLKEKYHASIFTQEIINLLD